jgi:uncharacterized membrane protein
MSGPGRRDEPVPAENVLVITLERAATAPDALGALTALAADGFALRAAAVVRRSTDGRISISGEVGDVDLAGTFAEQRPRLATLLTVLAGPLDTLLLGNSLVALTGALAEPSPDEVALDHLARAVPSGRAAVIAEVTESDPGLVDEALAGLGARIVRRPLADVEAEIGAARDAVAAVGAEARRGVPGMDPAPG